MRSSSRRHRSAWLAVAALSLAGCLRTYRPATPQVVTGERMNAVADRVTLGLFGAPTTVEVKTNATADTGLTDAKLTSVRADPCSAGLPFGAIEKDGTLETEGPLDVEGAHDLAFTFVPAFGEPTPLVGSSAVDIELSPAKGGTKTCLRVPLASDMPDRTWKPARSSAGFFVSFGARAYPAASGMTPGVEPIAAGGVRLGGASQEGRVWAEFFGGGDAHDQYGMILASFGGDRVLWDSGPWGFTGGLAYDVVVTDSLHPTSSVLYVLHGPRVISALTWAPFSNHSRFAGFPLGRRTAYFELEAPVSGWFGTRGAPAFVVAPAVGLTFNFAM